VLDGLQLVAAAVDAATAIACPRPRDPVTDELARRRAAGWDRIAVELVVARTRSSPARSRP
jgi:hypothetical protein